MKKITNAEYNEFQLLRRIDRINLVLKDIFKAENRRATLRDSEIKTRKGKALAKKWKILYEDLNYYNEKIVK